jgi:hypothetical protein
VGVQRKRPSEPSFHLTYPFQLALKDPDDLSFSANDIIHIVEETNADWWTGKVHGKQALFPSAYVEKLPVSSAVYNHAPLPPPVLGPVGFQQPQQQQQQAVQVEGKKKAGGLGKYKSTIAQSAAGGVGFGAGPSFS